ncbi:MAG: CPBP family intramembrane glutamic endopeptidase [Nocardioidaceae bacterium]
MNRPRSRYARVLARLPKRLGAQVPPTYPQSRPELARRRRVVAVVAVVGAGLLGLSLSTRPGSRRFYALTMGVAGTWAGGAVCSGPLHRGWIQARDDSVRRPVLTPVATGAGAFVLFYGAALMARRIPVLDAALVRVLRFADQGSAPLVVLTTCTNGLAEEVFFRGALYAAAGQRHPVAVSTSAYVAACLGTRNPALVLASVAMGTLFGLQRRASGGIQAPAVTHLVWSVLMLRYLPPLFRDRPARTGRL